MSNPNTTVHKFDVYLPEMKRRLIVRGKPNPDLHNMLSCIVEISTIKLSRIIHLHVHTCSLTRPTTNPEILTSTLYAIPNHTKPDIHCPVRIM